MVTFLSSFASAAGKALSVGAAQRREWREETRLVWSREFAKLPVEIDLPRLASRITLIDHREHPDPKEVLPPEPASSAAAAAAMAPASPGTVQVLAQTSAYDAILEFLWKVTWLLEGGAERAERLRTEWERTVARGVDMSAQRATVKKFISEIIGEDSRVGHLLKVCSTFFPPPHSGAIVSKLFFPHFQATNQAVVAPSTIEAHVGMFPTLPFKDSGARPWEVIIRLTDTFVEVAHLRGQCQMDRRLEDAAFEFVLETSLVFDRSLRELSSATVAVAEYSFGPRTTEAKKAEFSGLFNNHLKKHQPLPQPRHLSKVGRRPPGSLR